MESTFNPNPRRMGTILIMVVAALAILSGCNPNPGIRLSTYYNDVIGALPGTDVSSRAAFSDTGGPADALMNTLFSEDPEAVVSLPYGISALDAIITELNTAISADNTSGAAGVTVTPVTAGQITVPFFGGTVNVDYEVELGGEKKAAYLKSDTAETVVLYNTYVYDWTAPTTPINTRDHYVFFAHRTSAGAITIKFALYAEATSDDSYVKDWAAEITVDAQDNFSVRSVWGGVDGVGTENLSGSLAAAGNRTDGLGYRYLDLSLLEEHRFLVDSISEAEITWDQTAFDAYAVPELNGIIVAGADGQTGSATVLTASGSGRPKHDTFTSPW
jgi:hypothetical protein